VCVVHPCCVFTDVCLVLFLFCLCLHVCTYAFKSKVHCGSALGPGASGLPYYCTSHVCVPAVIGALTVWRHYTKKKSGEEVVTSFIFVFKSWLYIDVLAPTYILIFQRCLTLQDSPRCGARTHSFSILPCLALAYICGLGLYPFSELVCDLLPRRLFPASPKAHCRRVSQSQSWRALLGGHQGYLVHFPTQ